MRTDLVITGVGMVTPVGYGSAQTCTALFAGVSAFEELEGVVDSAGGPIVCAALPPPARNQLGDRLTSAAWAAMEEAMDDARVPSGVGLQVAFITADPVRPGPAVAADALEALAVERWGRSHDVRCQVVRAGNAGTANVLETLASTGAQRAAAAALVVAYDSLCSFDALRHLEGAGRLKTRVRARGAIPGEAAAAIVVETTSRVSRPCYASIAGLGIATEPVPVGVDAPCLGDGLTRAIADALSGAGWEEATHLATYCDMNGEEYRAHEWMLALCRTLRQPRVVHPADCIGDIGAASMPLLLGLASVRIRDGRRGEREALVWASSDAGLRGAACLRSPG